MMKMNGGGLETRSRHRGDSFSLIFVSGGDLVAEKCGFAFSHMFGVPCVDMAPNMYMSYVGPLFVVRVLKSFSAL